MTIDLDQVLYARASWRKAILVPLWTFQIAVLLCLMGIFAYRLAETLEHYIEHQKMGQVPMVEVVWEATNVGFNLISLVLNIIEIARKATERLTPFFMICTHVIKLTLAVAVLALDVVAFLQRMDGHYSTIGLALDCGLLAATLATFIYALTTYRRLLKYEDYHLTVPSNNPNNRNSSNASHLLGLGHKHSLSNPIPRVSVSAASQFYNREYDYADDSAPYHPHPYPSQTRWSASSAYSYSYSQPQQQPALAPAPASAIDGYGYGHEYQPLAGAEALKTQIDRAIGNEFGWGSGGAATGDVGGGGGGAAVGRSGSVVVASGKVPVHQGMMAVPAPELHRAHSWRVEEEGEEVEGGGGGGGAAATAMGGADPRGSPEAAGEGRRGEGSEEDREALLSGK